MQEYSCHDIIEQVHGTEAAKWVTWQAEGEDGTQWRRKENKVKEEDEEEKRLKIIEKINEEKG